jgi:hypothetical protein
MICLYLQIIWRNSSLNSSWIMVKFYQISFLETLSVKILDSSMLTSWKNFQVRILLILVLV